MTISGNRHVLSGVVLLFVLCLLVLVFGTYTSGCASAPTPSLDTVTVKGEIEIQTQGGIVHVDLGSGLCLAESGEAKVLRGALEVSAEGAAQGAPVTINAGVIYDGAKWQPVVLLSWAGLVWRPQFNISNPASSAP